QRLLAEYEGERSLLTFNIDELDKEGDPIIEVVLDGADMVGKIKKEDIERYQSYIGVARDAYIKIFRNDEEDETGKSRTVYSAEAIMVVPTGKAIKRKKQWKWVNRIGAGFAAIVLLFTTVRSLRDGNSSQAMLSGVLTLIFGYAALFGDFSHSGRIFSFFRRRR
ncbi:MAG: hypothetical protein II444_00850, partial [Firmicutes bacterium]|nr:hypothetical protein [Bacillota bacterium]